MIINAENKVFGLFDEVLADYKFYNIRFMIEYFVTN